MKTVLVTGAAGGVGMATIAKCVQKGYRVYAGAIDDWEVSEIERLKSTLTGSGNISIVMLDLRNQEQITSVIEQIESENPSWFGLVANGAACPNRYSLRALKNRRYDPRCFRDQRFRQSRVDSTVATAP